ncbi:hypothetical protein KO506_12880 [Polaribacter vadi]|uniref:hypothetical protein n=1 Tax=Polaribacter TaxID=52959 RepID=UPI001C092E74|nr:MULTISPECIES: hypothetical protein [Polaribacter]MBU3012303.1 hypothetical protein [Polaribacter vadi]MDO6742120.1 hypothetical protein [Polaribacter sp. 1_MG-2023]
METNSIIDYLDNNKIVYKLDENPTDAKISRIQKAIERKKTLMDLAVSTYKQVMRIA